MLETQIDQWVREPEANRFPFGAVSAHIMTVGKHFFTDDDVAALQRARAAMPRATGDLDRIRLLRAFLDVLLDKADDRYDYLTYTAMPLFPITRSLGDPAGVRDRTVSLLVADLLAFEFGSLDDPDHPLPQMRPSADLVAKRSRLGLRAALPAAERAGMITAGTHQADDDVSTARIFVAAVQASSTAAERELLALTMHPVYTIHDEHMFLRVLQSFEATFVLMVAKLREAIDALRAGDARTAAGLIQQNTDVFHEAGLLFSLLATMQVDSFRTFRTYTEGASAIQSEGYKTVESLCRRPDPERLGTLPYNSVPKVQARIRRGHLTIQDAARAQAHLMSADDADALATAMDGFEATLMRWRQTHHSLAVRMLGEQTGSGYSEGTPYLKSVIDIPVFNDDPGEAHRKGA